MHSPMILRNGDSDGDGYGDNPSGTNADAFPYDSTQNRDSDGDGYGDAWNGNNPDAFRYEPTQWKDADDDGYGDNPSGVNGDFCLGTSSDEKRNVDENGCGPSQRDSDNDGVNDALDRCDNSQDGSTANLEGVMLISEILMVMVWSMPSTHALTL